MNQIYLVIEDNGESYEDYQEWPVAAFDDSDKAKEYANRSQEAYDVYYAEGQANRVLEEEQQSKLFDAIPDDTYLDLNGINYFDIEISIYEYTSSLYPNSISQYIPIHTFRVSTPIPFNPS